MRQHMSKIDGSTALVHPRLPEEPLLPEGYVHDLEKYVKEHKRLYTMDHFSPYGPWSTDFTDWGSFSKSCSSRLGEPHPWLRGFTRTAQAR